MKSTRNQQVIICPPCGESALLRAKGGQNWKETLWPLLLVFPPQGRKMCGGFTLIELLVVVLIIGILAAVAVPQYQKSVEKSRAVEGITWAKSIGGALEAFYLQHGDLPTSFDELDIDVPNTKDDFVDPRKYWCGSTLKDIRTLSQDWVVAIWPSQKGVVVFRARGNYSGSNVVAFVYQLVDASNAFPGKKGLGCVEKKDFCSKLLGISGTPGSGCVGNYYAM